MLRRDEISPADVVLASMIWNAEAYDADFGGLRIIKKVYEEAVKLGAFCSAHSSWQEDCPEEFRSGGEKLPAY